MRATIPTADGLVTRNHNKPKRAKPPPREPDPALIKFAWKALRVICVALDEDAEVIAGKRQAKKARIIRKLWHHAMRGHFGPDAAVAEDLATIREEIDERTEDLEDLGYNEERMKGDITLSSLRAQRRILIEESRGRNWMLGTISGIGRDTVEDDQADVERWILGETRISRAGNTLISEAADEIRDMLEPLPGLISKLDSGALFEECEFEMEEDARNPRPVKSKRSPPPSDWTKTERATFMLKRGDAPTEVSRETKLPLGEIGALFYALRDAGEIAPAKAARLKSPA